MNKNEVFAQIEKSLNKLMKSYATCDVLYEQDNLSSAYVIAVGQCVVDASYLTDLDTIKLGPLFPFIVIGQEPADAILNRVTRVLGFPAKIVPFNEWYEKRGRGLYRNNIEIQQNMLNSLGYAAGKIDDTEDSDSL